MRIGRRTLAERPTADVVSDRVSSGRALPQQDELARHACPRGGEPREVDPARDLLAPLVAAVPPGLVPAARKAPLASVFTSAPFTS